MLDEPLLAPAADTSAQAASYSNDAVAPQAKDCEGMRLHNSAMPPGFDLRSYVLYGHLEDTKGTIIPFSTITQQTTVSLNGGPKTPVNIAGVTVNSGQGSTLAGIDGSPNETNAVSMTANPFSERAQTFTAGKQPQYVQARVVEGQLGQPGAIIEVTAQADGVNAATTASAPIQISVRVRDVTGVGQWGFGPSGFFPQWIYPEQRDAITNTFGGSVEEYLKASNDPMVNQGSYYYTSPVMEVESFTISQNGTVVNSGTKGELLMDYVTQSFDDKASAVVDNGVEWTEFSVLLDGQKTMKIGSVTQSSVGTYPYAMLLSADGDRLVNGSLAVSKRWNMGDITLAPDASETWTSPRSQKKYPTKYTAKLANSDPSKSADLTFTMVYQDQELNIGGRVVYEGLFKVTGTLDGAPATGYAWAEIQPSGSLG